MKSLFLFYESFAEFEISILSLCLKSSGCEVVTVGLRSDVPYINGEGGFRCIPHLYVDEVNSDEYDLLVIPGGHFFHLLGNKEVYDLLHIFFNKNKIIAAICGGTGLLADSGILYGKKFSTNVFSSDQEEYGKLFNWDNHNQSDVTCDSNVITANSNAYVEFAIYVAQKLGIFKNNDDIEETLRYFKNLPPKTILD